MIVVVRAKESVGFNDKLLVNRDLPGSDCKGRFLIAREVIPPEVVEEVSAELEDARLAASA